jgi:hypothetical protein
LIGLLVEAIKEITNEIEQMKTRIKSLENDAKNKN